jgi:hypothetical protein
VKRLQLGLIYSTHGKVRESKYSGYKRLDLAPEDFQLVKYRSYWNDLDEYYSLHIGRSDSSDYVFPPNGDTKTVEVGGIALFVNGRMSYVLPLMRGKLFIINLAAATTGSTRVISAQRYIVELILRDLGLTLTPDDKVGDLPTRRWRPKINLETEKVSGKEMLVGGKEMLVD